jgi:hypothetical protein
MIMRKNSKEKPTSFNPHTNKSIYFKNKNSKEESRKC